MPSTARTIGALAPTQAISATVTLNPGDPAGLEAYATAVSTPGNALYQHHLSTARFAADFGPSGSTIAAVQAALVADGLSPDAISANHLMIQIHGSTATFTRAFGTQFKQYRLATGRVAYANTSAPRLPSSIATGVQAVIGLDNLLQAHPKEMTKGSATRKSVPPMPQVATGGPQPCAAAVAAGPANAAYTADQIAAAYQVNGLYRAGDLGAGQTIAMFELESDNPADIAAYQACYRTATPISYVKVDAGTPPGAVGEATLDIENAIGIAPKAAQLVYQGPNTSLGVYDTYSSIISQNRATVISTSWGICELRADATETSAENTLFQEAAVQGQSLFDAAGDMGSEDCGDPRLSADDPAGQPFVTAVGGTTLINPTAATPTEFFWNRRAIGEGAGGAGISKFFEMPRYQSDAAVGLHVINANSTAAVCGAPAGRFCRQEPDISLDADPETGFLVYLNGGWTGFGGTSGGAPIWAAFAALTNASATCAGRTIGFVNPALYSLAGSNYAANFTDITSGNSDYTGTNGGLYPTAVGYDIASGLGTPKVATLVASLCGGPAVSPALVTGSYQALTPTRILDTRIGLGSSRTKVPAGRAITLTAANRGGVPSLTGPAGAAPSAININFTVSNATAAGYLTVYPTGSARPGTSNLNFIAGRDVANTTIAALGRNGTVTIFNGSAKPVDVMGDVAGYYLTGSTPTAPPAPGTYRSLINQARILDTRTLGVGGRLAAGRSRRLTVSTAGIPAGAAAVVLNVTSTGATGNGHLRVYATGATLPLASNLNFTTGRNVANEVLVKPGTNNQVSIFNGSHAGATHVVVDVIGYVAGGTVSRGTAGLQTAVTPHRLLDTRYKIGTRTVAKVAARGTRVVRVVGVDGVPATASAAVVTVTATDSSRVGFATVYAGPTRPLTSILNFVVGIDIANMMITPISRNGTITIFNGSAGPTDLVIDISAYITG